MGSAVHKCMFLDVVIINRISLIVVMSIACVLSNISLDTSSDDVSKCLVGLFVVFPFSQSKLGLNMSSMHIIFAFTVPDEIFCACITM